MMWNFTVCKLALYKNEFWHCSKQRYKKLVKLKNYFEENLKNAALFLQILFSSVVKRTAGLLPLVTELPGPPTPIELDLPPPPTPTPPPVITTQRLSSKNSPPLLLRLLLTNFGQKNDRKAIRKFSAFATYKIGLRAQLMYGNKWIILTTTRSNCVEIRSRKIEENKLKSQNGDQHNTWKITTHKTNLERIFKNFLQIKKDTGEMINATLDF